MSTKQARFPCRMPANQPPAVCGVLVDGQPTPTYVLAWVCPPRKLFENLGGGTLGKVTNRNLTDIISNKWAALPNFGYSNAPMPYPGADDNFYLIAMFNRPDTNHLARVSNLKEDRLIETARISMGVDQDPSLENTLQWFRWPLGWLAKEVRRAEREERADSPIATDLTTGPGTSDAPSPDHGDAASQKPEPANGAGKVFALVIGINDYLARDHFVPLKGAVNDARAFQKYLLDPREQRGLGVPPENVVLLENKEATREKILSTFKSHFLENPEIPDRGEATMILFYAGHGTRVQANNIIARDGKVEALSPVDERTIDAAGNYVYAIPDYVLGKLLSNLAATKGPNITVIFDACHSGGMGRDVGLSRNANSDSAEIPPDLDKHLWMERDAADSYSMWSRTANSHVLLAACREDETAREIKDGSDQPVHGRFTKALLASLRRVNLENTTYAELLDRVPAWSGQNPHYSGSRRNQLVFNRNYPTAGPRALLLMRGQPDVVLAGVGLVPSFRVKIGSVEGVVPGTEFALHAPGEDEHGNFLCTYVAHVVQIGETVIVPKNIDGELVPIPQGSRAIVSDWKNSAMIMHVYTAPGFLNAVFVSSAASEMRRFFVQAAAVETADISLGYDREKEEIVIGRLTSTIMEADHETRVKLSITGSAAAYLPQMMDGIAHFNYFLERHHGCAPLEGVSLEMHRLKGRYPERIPDLDFGHDGNLVENHAASLKLDDEAKYGFTLRNKSERDLYPYLFYFDPVSYTIHNWYSPESRFDRPPLPSEKSVTVGMGSDRAFEFSLLPHEISHSGFLKLFVSTEWLDLNWLRQETSPLEAKLEGVQRLGMNQDPFENVLIWDAITVMLTMTR